MFSSSNYCGPEFPELIRSRSFFLHLLSGIHLLGHMPCHVLISVAIAIGNQECFWEAISRIK